MKRINLFIILIFIFSLSCCALPASAETENVASDYLVEVGEYALKQGQVQTAVQEFQKALMVNPYNEKAMYYLQQLRFDQNSYVIPDEHIARMLRMEEQVDKYKRENEQLQANRLELQQGLARLKGDSLVRQKSDTGLVEQEVFSYMEEMEDEVSILKLEKVRFKKYAQDQYVYQDRLIHVLEDLLHYREDAVEDKKDDIIVRQIALAKNQNVLSAKMEDLVRLEEDLEKFRQKSMGNQEEIKKIKEDIHATYERMDELFHQREMFLESLKESVKNLKEM